MIKPNNDYDNEEDDNTLDIKPVVIWTVDLSMVAWCQGGHLVSVDRVVPFNRKINYVYTLINYNLYRKVTIVNKDFK